MKRGALPALIMISYANACVAFFFRASSVRAPPAWIVPSRLLAPHRLGAAYLLQPHRARHQRASPKPFVSMSVTPPPRDGPWLGPGYAPKGVDAVGPCSPMDAQLPVDKTGKRWCKHTKQIATVGPSCSSEEMLDKLFVAGVDVFRLNFSHGAHEEKRKVVQLIRHIEQKYRHTIGILADLQGPKLRIGGFKEDYVFVNKGQKFRLDLEIDTLGDVTRVALPHPEILQTLRKGDLILLDDGKVRLIVTEADLRGEWVDTEVQVGGKLSDRKGVNTPSIIIPISPLTLKDRSDLSAALDMGVDWVALSFVQKPSDMVELRQLVGERAFVMAKIEKPSAVERLDDIIALSDGVMVARGDLGVELMHEDVPILQRSIIDKCRRRGCPVVVATQMLESMITTPIPTRAEVNDVATALYLGADAIMLSAESAAGEFPTESVEMQCRIINRVEGSDNFFPRMQSRASAESVLVSGGHPHIMNMQEPEQQHLAYDSITSAAMLLADRLQARAMIVFTTTGGTAVRASRIRPSIPVIAMVQEKWLGRRLSLYWGIYPAYVDIVTGATNAPSSTDFDELMARACSIAWDQGFAHAPEDLFVVTAGLPFGVKGAANVIRI
eukprot:CAMPEP_0173428694 /NCGR_PEP_ID=MMETSP1357-20121228/7589_1 /TAXON_ID=77926 /ORGANISM="Hemiselmis rufescens, Strain PCC563" /LENGTH=609 /DNA_ID=CAMNT_0014392751 /DNA_START=68 /DNA_END=1894 /DNA_ORIENTATION=-